MRRTRVLIVGQGLVGTLLSFRLSQLGVEHLVADRGHEGASSVAAAGIVNPVTGRRFVLSWGMPQLLEGLQIYRELGGSLGADLLHPMRVMRDLERPAALNQWDMRRGQPDVGALLGAPVHASAKPFPNTPTTLGPTNACFRVDLPLALKRYRRHLTERGLLVEQEVAVDSLAVGNGGLRARELGVTADRVVDCTGARAMRTQRWGDLGWRGTKGESVRFRLDAAPRDAAYKRSAFVCPIGTRNEVWLGATNDDHDRTPATTEAGLSYLHEQAAGFGLEIPAEAQYLAGIRPTTRNRRPFVLEHPGLPGLWLCNGMGGKGTSLAPWSVNQLLESMW